MKFKSIDASKANTVAFDKSKLEKETNNIYEAINIIAKRANQINEDMKMEMNEKVNEFAYVNDAVEEVFENREQVEVSKFYERLPKPTQLAIEEWIEDKIYYRKPEEAEK